VQGRDRRTWLKVLAPVACSILGLVTLRLLGPDFVNQRELHAAIAPLGRWAPLAFMLLLMVRPVTLLPGQLFCAVGGMLFGTLAGTAYALVGSFLAAALVYALSRRLGTRLMRRWTGERYSALTRVARRHDVKFAILSTLNPLVPTDMMLAMAAASGARFWPTVAGVLLGTFPGTFLTVQFGSGLAQGRTVLTALSAAGLVVSLVLGVLLGRRMLRDFNAEAARQGPAPAGAAEADARAAARPRRSVRGAYAAPSGSSSGA
jgi:uncharacterized membrane protein YdjX (TVP38/TMEM64 family)